MLSIPFHGGSGEVERIKWQRWEPCGRAPDPVAQVTTLWTSDN